MKSINASIGSQTLYSISYGHNDNGQRDWASVTWKSAGGSDLAENWEFDYDEQDQLIFAHRYVDGEESGAQYDFEFDEVGNHVEEGWIVNALNQVKQVPGVTGEINYDGRGNVTYDGHFTYTWDAQDRLIKAENGSIKLEFGYDSQGRRTWKKSYNWIDEDWVADQHLIFAYDGWDLMAEFVVDGSGAPQLYRSYAWGPSLGGGIGGLLSITDHLAAGGAKTYYPFYDGNGNVMGLSDANGTVVATYKYDPFGKLVESAGPAADVNPHLFSTKYFDAETGLYYYGYRYYSPEMQRWMSRDPIEENGGLNLYAFAQNDPVNRVDALGLDASDDARRQRTENSYKATGFRLMAGYVYSRIAKIAGYFNEDMSAAVNWHPHVAAPSFSTDSTITTNPRPMRPKTSTQAGILMVGEYFHSSLNRTANALEFGDAGDGTGYALYQGFYSISFDQVPVAANVEKAWSGKVIDDWNGGLAQLSGKQRVFHGTLAGVEAALIVVPLPKGASRAAVAGFEADVLTSFPKGSVFIPATETVGVVVIPLRAEVSLPARLGISTGGVAVNPAGLYGKNPMIEVTRTTPSVLVKEARLQFKNRVTGRAMFLDEFASTPDAKMFYTSEELQLMHEGTTPLGWIVHHKKPIFRGGGISYDNQIVVPKKWHQDHYFELHFYPEGKNPFGAN